MKIVLLKEEAVRELDPAILRSDLGYLAELGYLLVYLSARQRGRKAASQPRSGSSPRELSRDRLALAGCEEDLHVAAKARAPDGELGIGSGPLAPAFIKKAVEISRVRDQPAFQIAGRRGPPASSRHPEQEGGIVKVPLPVRPLRRGAGRLR